MNLIDRSLSHENKIEQALIKYSSDYGNCLIKYVETNKDKIRIVCKTHDCIECAKYVIRNYDAFFVLKRIEEHRGSKIPDKCFSNCICKKNN